MKCSYCSGNLVAGSGMMYVYNSGTIRYYCSSRCYKNDVVLKRKFNKKEARAKK